MNIALAADHAGFALKQTLLPYVSGLGHEVLDFAAAPPDPNDDYPDFAESVALALLHGKAERGILICGSGVGAAVAVNKIKGARGCLCHDSYSARQGVEHDNLNVLVLGSRIIGDELAKDLVQIFLAARFSGAARHLRRLAKVKALEDKVPS